MKNKTTQPIDHHLSVPQWGARWKCTNQAAAYRIRQLSAQNRISHLDDSGCPTFQIFPAPILFAGKRA